eukprot:TRINITY_DN3607_c2_g1_i2.p1 TRINITY_DN3607_c2_g1~~TRINITY_DN3607_c2_g1_i2.p1  ORF type:complete len:390 (+),score=60.98 TRINITY_DN3607_c2_g1_i2:94-1263(+)
MCLSKFQQAPDAAELKLIAARIDLEVDSKVDRLAERLVAGSPLLRRGLLPFLELGLDSYEFLSSIVTDAAAVVDRSGSIAGALASSVSCGSDALPTDAEEQQQVSGSLELCFFSSAALLASFAANGGVAFTVTGFVQLGAATASSYAVPTIATCAFAIAIYEFMTKHRTVSQRRIYNKAAAAVFASAAGEMFFLLISQSTVIPLLPIRPGFTVGEFFGLMKYPMLVVYFIVQSIKLQLTIGAIGQISGCTQADLKNCNFLVRGSCMSMAAAAVVRDPALRWPLLLLGTGFQYFGMWELNDNLPAAARAISLANTQRARVAAGWLSAFWSLTPVIEALPFLGVVSASTAMNIFTVTDLFMVLGATHLAVRSKEAVSKADHYVGLRELDQA